MRSVNAQERSPTCRGWAATSVHLLSNSRLGDVDTKFQQLTMNTRRAPQRVMAADCANQIADLGRDLRPADTASRLPTPVETEAASMPANQRLGLEDDCGSEQRRKQPIEPDEDQSTCGTQSEPWSRRSPQDEKLVAKEHDLGFAAGMRSESPTSHPPSNLNRSIIPPKLPHCCACASPDEIFGRHSRLNLFIVRLSSGRGHRCLVCLIGGDCPQGERPSCASAGGVVTEHRASTHGRRDFDLPRRGMPWHQQIAPSRPVDQFPLRCPAFSRRVCRNVRRSINWPRYGAAHARTPWLALTVVR